MTGVVLDVCCGSKMMWFDRADERAVYNDVRNDLVHIIDKGTAGTVGRKPVFIKPDTVEDFRKLSFPDESFYHVVFDPPHLTPSRVGYGDSSTLAFKYGKLEGEWREGIKAGFSECFRVLKPNGTLIFKWCETQFPLKEILALTPHKPLYGHRSGKKAQTHWVAFIKSSQLEKVA